MAESGVSLVSVDVHDSPQSSSFLSSSFAFSASSRSCDKQIAHSDFVFRLRSFQFSMETPRATERFESALSVSHALSPHLMMNKLFFLTISRVSLNFKLKIVWDLGRILPFALVLLSRRDGDCRGPPQRKF